MRTLITGGAGFLGLHLANYFHQKGHQLILVDINGYPKGEYPENNCQLIKADVRDSRAMGKLTKEVDFVVHGAAALPLWKREEIFSTNVEGTRTVLQASLKNKVKRFVHISSTAVYGVPIKHPIMEADPLVGVGPYGESKILAEAECNRYRKKGLVVTVVRPKTFIGTHRLGVFEILYDWVKDGKRIPMIGNAQNHYQLLDVDDLVEAVYLLLKNSQGKIVNQNFNIGAAQFGRVEDDLQALFNYAQSGSRLLKTPAWPIKKALWVFEKLGISPLYQWVYDTADKDSFVSIDLLTKTLKWQPHFSNSQALIKSYQWYLDHYQEIKSKKAGVTHTVGWNQGILGLFKKWL